MIVRKQLIKLNFYLLALLEHCKYQMRTFVDKSTKEELVKMTKSVRRTFLSDLNNYLLSSHLAQFQTLEDDKRLIISSSNNSK